MANIRSSNVSATNFLNRYTYESFLVKKDDEVECALAQLLIAIVIEPLLRQVDFSTCKEDS